MIEVGKVSEKNMKMGTYVGIVVLVLLGIGLLIVPKVKTLMDRQQTYKEKIAELEQKETELQTVTAEYERLKKEKEKYEAVLSELRRRFREASLKDETHLKILVQTLINVLDLEMLFTGKKGDVVKKDGYTKEYIPYEIQGDFDQVARFFHYLENSKWLITFKGSELDMKGIKITKKYGKNEYTYDKVKTKFKAGYYLQNQQPIVNDEKDEKNKIIDNSDVKEVEVENMKPKALSQLKSYYRKDKDYQYMRKMYERQYRSLTRYMKENAFWEGVYNFPKGKNVFKTKVYDTKKIEEEKKRVMALIDSTFVELTFIIKDDTGRWSATFYYMADDKGTRRSGGKQRKTITGALYNFKVGGEVFNVVPGEIGGRAGLKIIHAKTKWSKVLYKQGR
jgi:Tfp pilus assembly protein PilN